MAASIEIKTLMAEWFHCAVLAHGTHQVDDECEHVKETGIVLLRFCGIWSTTKTRHMRSEESWHEAWQGTSLKSKQWACRGQRFHALRRKVGGPGCGQ